MDEMNSLTVDANAMVLEGVEPRFLRAPVVFGSPILDELAQVFDRDAVLPSRAGDLIGETRAREPRAQVVEDRVVDPDLIRLDLQRLDRVGHGAAQETASNSRWSCSRPRSM